MIGNFAPALSSQIRVKVSACRTWTRHAGQRSRSNGKQFSLRFAVSGGHKNGCKRDAMKILDRLSDPHPHRADRGIRRRGSRDQSAAPRDLPAPSIVITHCPMRLGNNVSRRRLLLGIGVELDQLHFGLELASCRFVGRGHHAAPTAPGRSDVDQHR